MARSYTVEISVKKVENNFVFNNISVTSHKGEMVKEWTKYNDLYSTVLVMSEAEKKLLSQLAQSFQKEFNEKLSLKATDISIFNENLSTLSSLSKYVRK